MKLTTEQEAIINSTGNIKINAVAGSGKTTTIIEYAKAVPGQKRILYLAFNKSVRIDAAKRFARKGLNNVSVETAHSLAFKNIVPKNNYRVRTTDFKPHETVQILGLRGTGEKHTEYIFANHVSRFVAYFCNSDKRKVQDLNYLDVVSDNKARAFVSVHYDYIIKQTRLLLSKMDKGEIEITHDFYLKKFQLANPRLPYDYILFDEGQDASPAMLDVFLKQKAVKVIVGDTHQQIYGWRFAVNSLEKADFKTYRLSTSFRFGGDIAQLAVGFLQWKKLLDGTQAGTITGKGDSKEQKVKAIIARTNLGLLLKAIEHVTEKKEVKKIYFEGNINSYTYADEGASLYDVLNLHTGKRRLIRDKLIGEMKNLEELEQYIEKTEDMQLGMMVEIVKEYGDKIPEIINSIKAKHVGDAEKENAEVIFSTVHRCKGMEYDSVQLVNDFITEEKLKKQANEGLDPIRTSKLNEEINLLYVAATRCRNNLVIPESLLPEGFPASPNIRVMKVEKEEEKNEKADRPIQQAAYSTTEKAYSFSQVRESHKDAYRPWTPELDDELTAMFCEGINLRDLAKHFGRTKGAISSRVKKLELREKYA